MKAPLRSTTTRVVFFLIFFGLSAVAQNLTSTPANPADLASSDETTPGQSVALSSPSASNPTIPGPLRSFLRMAGISQKVSPEEVFPLLARNVEL